MPSGLSPFILFERGRLESSYLRPPSAAVPGLERNPARTAIRRVPARAAREPRRGRIAASRGERPCWWILEGCSGPFSRAGRVDGRRVAPARRLGGLLRGNGALRLGVGAVRRGVPHAGERLSRRAGCPPGAGPALPTSSGTPASCRRGASSEARLRARRALRLLPGTAAGGGDSPAVSVHPGLAREVPEGSSLGRSRDSLGVTTYTSGLASHVHERLEGVGDLAIAREDPRKTFPTRALRPLEPRDACTTRNAIAFAARTASPASRYGASSAWVTSASTPQAVPRETGTCEGALQELPEFRPSRALSSRTRLRSRSSSDLRPAHSASTSAGLGASLAQLGQVGFPAVPVSASFMPSLSAEARGNFRGILRESRPGGFRCRAEKLPEVQDARELAVNGYLGTKPSHALHRTATRRAPPAIASRSSRFMAKNHQRRA